MELLVVLAISSTLLALVGPLGYRSVEKAKFQTELVSIQRWLNRMGYTAFIRGETVRIRAVDNRRLVAFMGSKVLGEKDIDRVVLADSQPIFFTSSGIPSRRQVSVVNSKGLVLEIPLAGALSVRSAY